MNDVERVIRWQETGGTWKVLASTPAEVLVALLSCDAGEEMDRFRSADPALLSYLRSAASPPAAPPAAAQRMPVTTFTSVHGLSHEYVFDVLTDSRGFVWLATQDGVSRFDGAHIVNMAGDDWPVRGTIRALAVTSAGGEALHGWIATEVGLYRYAYGAWNLFSSDYEVLDLAAALGEVAGYAEEDAPEGLSTRVTGNAVLLGRAADEVAWSQPRTVGLAAVAIFILLAVGFASYLMPGLLIFVSFGLWITADSYLCQRFFAANDDRVAARASESSIQH